MAEKSKGGRPKKDIDKLAFEKLCGLQCTREEICCFFNISEKTLDSWCKRTYKESFSLVFATKRGNGKISLRRAQFRLAEKSPAMAIWLGKQYLNQHEPMPKPEQEETPDDGFMEALHTEAKDTWQE